MANFVKCKQESVKFKRNSSKEKAVEITVLLFWKAKRTVSEEVPGEDFHNNSPINLDLVKAFSKTKRILDRDSRWVTMQDGKEKYGIYFSALGGSSYDWYYDDEKTRDEQFEEIASNHHEYKTKVNF